MKTSVVLQDINLNNPSIIHLSTNQHLYKSSVRDCPELLLEGMAEYFQLQTVSSKTDTVNYSPSKKNGWRLITKGILNTSTTQHQIFKDNLRKINPHCTERYRKAFLLSEPVDVKPGRFCKSDKFLAKNKENTKLVGLFNRAQRRIEDLDVIKSTLTQYKVDAPWVYNMKTKLQKAKSTERPVILYDENREPNSISNRLY